MLMLGSVQPTAGRQVSRAPHTRSEPGLQLPLSQMSFSVHMFPSVQVVPLGRGGFEQPRAESHVPTSWH